jgi:ribosomal protein S18 acetylase RimI-like enzyme
VVVSPGPSGAGPGLAAGPPGRQAGVLTTIDLDGTRVTLRRATRPDLPALVALLAADDLGASRDGIRGPADRDAYERAFRTIDQDPAQLLLAAEAQERVVGTLQLSFIPGLSRRGALRAQIESVRVAPAMRGRGLGEALFTWSIAEARRRGCALVQLTTDKTRVDAHRFYERLGFTATHEGLKLPLV